MVQIGHFEKKIKIKKLRIDLKWREMHSKVIQNGRRQPFCDLKNQSNTYLSETARNVIKSDFRSSKMAAGSLFVEKIKVAYWSEMARNAIESDFRSSKMVASTILWTK